MKATLRQLSIFSAFLLIVTTLQAQVSKTDGDLSAPDGLKLKITYYSPGKPGPGVLLLHQCNQDRRTWDPLAKQLSQSGVHVLTFDYRGFGESAGDRFSSLSPEQRAAAFQKMPGDIDTAFSYLLAQPGVDKTRIGAGGASCGVNNSIQLARRHHEVGTLVLLSGQTDQDGRGYLQKTESLSLFVSASEDDGDLLPYMRWLFAFSHNPRNKFVSYKTAGHGTDMFAMEKGLEPMIFDWFTEKLKEAPTAAPVAAGSNPTQMEEFWAFLTQPGGAARAGRMFEEMKKKDPNVFLFPEVAVNLLGYEYLQKDEAKTAIEVLKLNELAYPRSANVYDSLGDGYLADHQDGLALKYSEKALKVLEENPPADTNRAKAIRESAQDKIRKLRPQ